MPRDWQTLAAMICVCVAGCWLLRQLGRAIWGPSQGSSCGGCSGNTGSDRLRTKPLVTLDLPPRNDSPAT